MNWQQLIQAISAALIAVILTVAVVGIISYEAVNGRPFDVPAELWAPWTMIVAYFYGQHAATNGARQAGVAIAQTTMALAAKPGEVPPSVPGNP
jgi:hypothetical protein